MKEKITINQEEYTIIKLIGHGKGGYSYLGKKDNELYVLKCIHHEPCSYYQFGDKMASELRDYQTLKSIGINIPQLIDYDLEQEVIVKEYIDGPTIDELVLHDEMKKEYIEQLSEMCKILYKSNINIDYFPTNFVVKNGTIYYIDFECNQYSDDWNFENWGIKYWSKTEEFINHFIKKK